MSITVNSAANFICDRGNWTVTNLALQKILYMAQMVHLGRGNPRLIDATFEAWDYGPVLPPLYRRVKPFGDKPIQDIFFGDSIHESSPEHQTLAEVCTFLLPKRPGELVAITHWQQGAWAKHYRPGVKGIVIPDADIIDEYRARTQAN